MHRVVARVHKFLLKHHVMRYTLIMPGRDDLVDAIFFLLDKWAYDVSKIYVSMLYVYVNMGCGVICETCLYKCEM